MLLRFSIITYAILVFASSVSFADTPPLARRGAAKFYPLNQVRLAKSSFRPLPISHVPMKNAAHPATALAKPAVEKQPTADAVPEHNNTSTKPISETSARQLLSIFAEAR